MGKVSPVYSGVFTQERGSLNMYSFVERRVKNMGVSISEGDRVGIASMSTRHETDIRNGFREKQRQMKERQLDLETERVLERQSQRDICRETETDRARERQTERQRARERERERETFCHSILIHMTWCRGTKQQGRTHGWLRHTVSPPPFPPHHH